MAESQTGRRFSTEELKDAGASEHFITVYLSATGGIHKVRNTLDNGHTADVMERDGDPTRAAGGFFTKLWEGHTFDALLHADTTNARLMFDILGAEEILEQGVNVGGYGLDYAKTMIEEKAERVGAKGL